MQQDTTQLPSPALGAMDDLLARREKALALVQGAAAVSYTHLTLPTIYSV